MEREQYQSRHFLGTQANVLRSLPFAPPGNPSDDGITLRHRLLALADWHEDSQVQCLAMTLGMQFPSNLLLLFQAIMPPHACHVQAPRNGRQTHCQQTMQGSQSRVFLACSNTGCPSWTFRWRSTKPGFRRPWCRSWLPGKPVAASTPWR